MCENNINKNTQARNDDFPDEVPTGCSVGCFIIIAVFFIVVFLLFFTPVGFAVAWLLVGATHGWSAR